MILWGWGKRTVKQWGQIRQTCPYCHNTGWFNVLTVRTWFTIFFVPVIPYRMRHVMVCTNCGGSVELDAERMAQAKHVIASGDAQLAAYEQEVAAQRDAAALRRAAGTETDADRLRVRMEQRNRNWDDRRS